MSEELQRPSKKNPLERSNVPLLPPGQRSLPTLGLLLGAADGRFMLQTCAGCGHVIYPVSDICPECLGQDLSFVETSRGASLLSEVTIYITADPYFRRRPPTRQGLVKADCGVTMISLLHRDCPPEGRVALSIKTDGAGQPVVFAHPETGGGLHMQDDPVWRELTAQPKFRRILITDGRSPVAVPLIKQLLAAGADSVFVGVSERWKPHVQLEQAVSELDGVSLHDLDLRDERSVSDLASEIGGKTDILINTAHHFRPGSMFDAGQTLRAKDAIDISALGLLRLVQTFGSAMLARAGDGERSAAAWVNVLSIWSQQGRPASAIYAAAQAAELSLAQSLRGEMSHVGVRVSNIFVGPMEEPWFEDMPPPKVAPAALAKAILKALNEGLEDSYVGDIAVEFRDRMSRNPKEVERLMWRG
jgi:NAD(P)-dependent dehydrogenase (short-subunit alcohol dehydrogenase family)/uncharacterized OB-fold protein